jgi:hypothetical protein
MDKMRLKVIRSVEIPAILDAQRDGGPTTYLLKNDDGKVRIGSYIIDIAILKQALSLIGDDVPPNNLR